MRNRYTKTRLMTYSDFEIKEYTFYLHYHHRQVCKLYTYMYFTNPIIDSVLWRGPPQPDWVKRKKRVNRDSYWDLTGPLRSRILTLLDPLCRVRNKIKRESLSHRKLRNRVTQCKGTHILDPGRRRVPRSRNHVHPSCQFWGKRDPSKGLGIPWASVLES